MVRRTRVTPGLVGVLVASFGAVASCSLINSYDPVDQGTGGASAGSLSITGTGAATGTSTSVSSSTGGPPPTRGLIVAAAKVVTDAGTTTTRVFTAIDPLTGLELSTNARQAIAAVGITYDPATDLWYIFEADNFPPLPTHAITLHVGQFDDKDGVFTHVASTSTIPVLKDPSTIGVLNGRLVYRAYDPANAANHGIAVLDTTPLATNAPPKKPTWGGYLQVQDFFGFIPLPSPKGGGN